MLTIADQRRVTRDPAYANGIALRLLDFLERIESLRGTGRLLLSALRSTFKFFSAVCSRIAYSDQKRPWCSYLLPGGEGPAGADEG